MSIVRVGLGETKKFAEGYEAIFGKKSGHAKKKPARVQGGTTRKKKKTGKKK